ncbi:MAG: hypothetical protein QXF26_08400 [Candidatus Bathyarchaeia archaeon]
MTSKTRRWLSHVAIFACLMAIFDAAPGLPQLSSGVWYGWTFIAEPIIGVFLDPPEAFFSALIGVMAGQTIGFRGDIYEFVFALGAPVGALVTSLTFRGRVAPVTAYYLFSLSTYFLSPNSNELPHWALWDTYLAFFALLTVILFGGKLFIGRTNAGALTFSAFIGLEADILFRIFVFIPLGTYKWLYGFPVEFVQAVWVVSAVLTPIQVGLGTLLTFAVGRHLHRDFKRLRP